MQSPCVLLMAAFSAALSSAYAQEREAYMSSLSPAPAPEHVALNIDEPLDASDVAYEVTMSWVKRDEWQAKVKSVRGKFEDWEAYNDGDIGRYLNDRMICVAMGCAGGKIESLKNAFAFLALYKEFNQQVPSLVEKIFREHRESLLKLFGEFTWERASEYIKNKEWRKDASSENNKRSRDRDRDREKMR